MLESKIKKLFCIKSSFYFIRGNILYILLKLFVSIVDTNKCYTILPNCPALFRWIKVDKNVSKTSCLIESAKGYYVTKQTTKHSVWYIPILYYVWTYIVLCNISFKLDLLRCEYRLPQSDTYGQILF